MPVFFAADVGFLRLNQQVEIIWKSEILLPTGICERYNQTYQIYVKQRSCADVNSPYKRKCWTNSVVPL